MTLIESSSLPPSVDQLLHKSSQYFRHLFFYFVSSKTWKYEDRFQCNKLLGVEIEHSIPGCEYALVFQADYEDSSFFYFVSSKTWKYEDRFQWNKLLVEIEHSIPGCEYALVFQADFVLLLLRSVGWITYLYSRYKLHVHSITFFTCY